MMYRAARKHSYLSATKQRGGDYFGAIIFELATFVGGLNTAPAVVRMKAAIAARTSTNAFGHVPSARRIMCHSEALLSTAHTCKSPAALVAHAKLGVGPIRRPAASCMFPNG